MTIGTVGGDAPIADLKQVSPLEMAFALLAAATKPEETRALLVQLQNAEQAAVRARTEAKVAQTSLGTAEQALRVRGQELDAAERVRLAAVAQLKAERLDFEGDRVLLQQSQARVARTEAELEARRVDAERQAGKVQADLDAIKGTLATQAAKLRDAEVALGRRESDIRKREEQLKAAAAALVA